MWKICEMCFFCSEEDIVVGGHDSSGAQGIFPPSNLKSGHILAIIRMLRDNWSRMANLSAGAVRRKLMQGDATHPIYATITHLFSACKIS